MKKLKNAMVKYAVDEAILQENNKLSAEYEINDNINSDIYEGDLYDEDNMSLDEKKRKKERHKRAFESELEYIYDI